MKSSLVFVLFGVILVLNNVEAQKCVPAPPIFIENMRHCLEKLNNADQELYFRWEQPDKREFQCVHLCLLEKNGYFKDGEFNLEKMKEVVRELMPTEELAEALIARNEDSMRKATEIGGDNCELAHEFMKIKSEQEKKEPLLSRIFC